MKKLRLLFLMLATATIFASGCSKDEPNLSVSKTSFSLTVGEQAEINAIIQNTDKELELVFKSDNKSVATVQNGTITAVNEGSANIKVSIKDYPNKFSFVTVTVSLSLPSLTLTGETEVIRTKTITLIATDSNSVDNSVFWESLDPTILSVDQNGVITGISEGIGKVRITSMVTGDILEKDITVIVPEPTLIEFESVETDISLTSDITLKAVVLPEGALQNIIWSSSDENIATVDQNGHITPVDGGTVTITATVEESEITAALTFTIVPTVEELLEMFHVDEPIAKKITVYGFEVNGNYQYNLVTSVSHFLFANLQVTEAIIPTSYSSRTGITQTSTNYITVHDTAAANAGKGSVMHKNYVTTGGGGTSWHYTVGNDGIFHHLPITETAKHAGDGGRPYMLIDTGVKAIRKNPVVRISPDSYYTLDSIKTNVEAPKNGDTVLSASNINDLGIEIVIGENGNWFIGNTYFNPTYNLISNGGGNANSIGIESCVDKGSDIFLTWQYLAKLVASLIIETNLSIESVVQHHYFSGKDCPMTMRHANMWPEFLKLVKAEYFAAKYLSDYSFTLTSNSTHIGANGRIISLPDYPTTVSYTIKAQKNNDAPENFTFNIVLPAKFL